MVTFPNFDLEDKVRLWERGNVMHPPILFTYKRRKQQNKETKVGTRTQAEIVEGSQGQRGNLAPKSMQQNYK